MSTIELGEIYRRMSALEEYARKGSIRYGPPTRGLIELIRSSPQMTSNIVTADSQTLAWANIPASVNDEVSRLRKIGKRRRVKR